MESIVAIVVLYQQTPAGSATLASLRAAFAAEPSLIGRLHLLVADNSPERHPMDDDLCATYLHDGANPGLARRYNHALAEARLLGSEWLLLLDQDTTLTADYLREACDLSAALANESTVCAIVPKLMARGQMISPHLPQFVASTFALDRRGYGVQPGLLRAYNSAALVRVSALQAVGGFPEAYWLDYLDHAVFHRLQRAGGRVFLMQAELEHDISIFREDRHGDPAWVRRRLSQLQAELRFYGEYGSPDEQRRHRLHMARNGLRSLRHGQWGEALRLLHFACARGPRP